jgi:hypothetical protein
VQQWINEEQGVFAEHIATQAARWGADQELNACCEWIYKLMDRGLEWSMDLRADRRPKPPSLKEQALAKLPERPENMASHLKLTPGEVATIRRALESLPD